MIKLIISSIKRNKKQSLILILTTLLIMGTLTSMIGYYNSISNEDYLQATKGKGSYQHAVSEISKEEKAFIEQYAHIADHNSLFIYGENEYGYIGYIDSTSLFDFSFYEGSYPVNEKEIAIDHSLLIKMGYEEKLNQPIELSYTNLEGQGISQTYILVGIINSYITLTEQPKFITTPTNQPAKEYYYYSGDFDYSIIYEDNELFEEYLQYQNNILYNRSIYLNRSSNHITFELIAMIVFLSLILSYMNMNRVVNQQRNMIVLLRGIGAKKWQITVWMFGQVLILSGIGIILGLILGFIISYSMIKHMNIAYYIDIGQMIEFIIIVLLPICFGVIFPTYKAMNVPLTGRLKQKIKRIHSTGKELITIPFLVRRRFSFNLIKHIVLILITSISLSVMIKYGIKILDHQSDKNYSSMIYNKDVEITQDSCLEEEKLPPLTLQDVNTLSKLNGITEVHYIARTNKTINLHRKNAYQQGFQIDYAKENSQEAIGEIITLDLYNSNLLEKYNIDPEEYQKGNVVMIYLPEQVYFDEGYFDYLYINTLNYDHNYWNYPHAHGLYDDTIHIGDQFEYNGKTITIGAIITGYNELSVEIRNPYTIIGSSQLVEKEVVQSTLHFIALLCEQSVDYDLLQAKLTSMYPNRSCYFPGMFQDNTKEYISEGYQKYAAYAIGGLLVSILVIYEYINDIILSRKDIIAIYHLTGMSYQQIRRMLLIDYLIMIIPTTFLAFILGLSSQFKHIHDFGIYVSYPKHLFPYVLLCLAGIIMITTLLYMISANSIIKQNNSLKAKE